MQGPRQFSGVTRGDVMKKKKVKKLELAKETIAALLARVEGGATARCATIPCTDGCPTGPIACQSGAYPC